MTNKPNTEFSIKNEMITQKQVLGELGPLFHKKYM